MIDHSGNILIVVAPSGAGKSSLIKALLQQDASIALSTSCTTRAPRPGEKDGEDYQFISVEKFERMRDRRALLEWAEVHGHCYGTPVDRLSTALRHGRDVLLEIDWQGARQVKKRFPHAIGVFVLPPSIDELERRLKSRGQDEPSIIYGRLKAAKSEILHASECEYVIINQDFSAALQQLMQLVQVARLRFQSQAARNLELFAQLGIPAKN